MGKMDIAMNNYLSTPDILADFIQQLIFKNRVDISEDMIELLPETESISLTDSKKEKTTHIKKYRDLLTRVNNTFFCLIVGIEGQLNLLNIMPLKSMQYDVLNYEKQVNALRDKHRKAKDLSREDFTSGISSDDRLIPVVTVCFYYGEKPWDRAKDLHDMLDFSGIDQSARELINNYKLNLIDIHDIDSTDGFKTSLGNLIDLMKIRNDKKALMSYIDTHQEFLTKTSEQAFDLIASMVQSQWLIDKKKQYRTEEEEFDMCTGMKEWLADVRDEGYKSGEKAGREIGYKSGEERGRRENAVETARKMLSRAMPLDLITELSGLSPSEIEALKNME